MTQARLIHRAESKLAVQRGTSRPLKDYGAWMVIYQQQMLDDLHKIASRHGIHTTSTLNDGLATALSEITELHGKKFDTRYIKSMVAEHKRDLKRLERASYSQDPDVQVFAARYVSLVKDNLAKLQAIRRDLN
jgi:putative membrane protein